MLKRTLLLSLLPLFAWAEDLPAPVKAIEKQGITIIKSFDAPGGMKGYLGKYQDMGVTIYLTPDGKQAISGYMYNEKGENLSNQLIEKEIYAPAGREMWQRMEKADGFSMAKKRLRWCCMFLLILSVRIANSSGNRPAHGWSPAKSNCERYSSASSNQRAQLPPLPFWHRTIRQKPGMIMKPLAEIWRSRCPKRFLRHT